MENGNVIKNEGYFFRKVKIEPMHCDYQDGILHDSVPASCVSSFVHKDVMYDCKVDKPESASHLLKDQKPVCGENGVFMSTHLDDTLPVPGKNLELKNDILFVGESEHAFQGQLTEAETKEDG
ncbi:unnamed protein product, partial [Lymnaea stagnalis]